MSQTICSPDIPDIHLVDLRSDARVDDHLSFGL